MRLRGYQQEAVNQILACDDPKEVIRAIGQLEPGSGRTIVISHVITSLMQKLEDLRVAKYINVEASERRHIVAHRVIGTDNRYVAMAECRLRNNAQKLVEKLNGQGVGDDK